MATTGLLSFLLPFLPSLPPFHPLFLPPLNFSLPPFSGRLFNLKKGKRQDPRSKKSVSSLDPSASLPAGVSHSVRSAQSLIPSMQDDFRMPDSSSGKLLCCHGHQPRYMLLNSLSLSLSLPPSLLHPSLYLSLSPSLPPSLHPSLPLSLPQ